MFDLVILNYEARPISGGGRDQWVTFSYRTWWWPFRRTATWFCCRQSKQHEWVDENGGYHRNWPLGNLVIRHEREAERDEELMKERPLRAIAGGKR